MWSMHVPGGRIVSNWACQFIVGCSNIKLLNGTTARDPGVVGLLPYAKEGRFVMYYGLIVDGYHTHDASIRLAYAMHPAGWCCCAQHVF